MASVADPPPQLDPEMLAGPPGRVRSSITWRSVLAGLVGVIGICALTPYNDYALNNAAMVGNNLPIGAMLFMFILAVGVNGPLSVLAPRWALSTGELVVAFSMTLVACALPSAG